MRRHLAVLLVVLPVVLTAPAFAQPLLTIEWDQPDATPLEAQAYLYRMYLDDLPPVLLENVLCRVVTANPPTVCNAKMPPVTHGLHRVYLIVSNEAGDSPPSPVTEFRYPLPPQPPKNLRIIR